MLDERIVRFRPRAILTVIGVVLAVAIVLEVIWVTRSVIIWLLIALFLAMALNPAVDFLVRRGMKRGPAVGIVFIGAILVIVGIAATFVPTLVREVNDLADAVPGYIDDLTRGRGRLGFLEREYHIVERAREAIEKSGAGGVLGLSNTALSLTKSILNAVIAVVTIAFLTLFMLLEGPAWVERIYGLHVDPRLEVGSVGMRVGALTSAADLIELRLTSPGGHTSRPHLTADLVHALGTVITSLPAVLSRRVDPRSGTVLVWGAVHAGQAANAVPQDGVLRGTLRTADHEVWTALEPLVASSVESLLAPTGVGFSLDYRRGVPPVVSDAESTALMRAGVEAALGERALAGTEQSSGGEDFGWYLEHVQGAFARLGVWSGPPTPQSDIHRPTFILDERALLCGVRTLVHTALTALA